MGGRYLVLRLEESQKPEKRLLDYGNKARFRGKGLAYIVVISPLQKLLLVDGILGCGCVF